MVGHGDYYDALELRSPDERLAAQLGLLRNQLTHAKAHAPHYADLLAGLDPAAVVSLADLAGLPVTRKSALSALQQDKPPFAGLVALPPAQLARVFQSPGPIYEVEGHGTDTFRFARAMWAAGLRPGELVHNTFSYHLTPAGMLMESAAHAIGCPVFPAGVGNTELQVQAIAHLKPAAYGGTPSFLKILLDKGRELGADVASITKALVGGEALPPSLRAELQDRGVTVRSSYGTAELGLIAYESPALAGMVIDEGVIVEIVRPGTGDPVEPGEVGEVLVTLLQNRAMPLIRYATGDLSAVLPGASPCGRTNMRIKGWMGRADQSTQVKGMFVTPGQVAEVARRHPGIGRLRLVVTNQNNVDAMTLRVEAAEGAEAIAESLQAVCKLRGAVELVPPGSLPNDGKVISDERSYA
jgi:phenylacetate-CoA ligase